MQHFSHPTIFNAPVDGSACNG